MLAKVKNTYGTIGVFKSKVRLIKFEYTISINTGGNYNLYSGEKKRLPCRREVTLELVNNLHSLYGMNLVSSRFDIHV